MRRSADALKNPTYVEDKDSGELRRRTILISRPACIGVDRSSRPRPKSDPGTKAMAVRRSSGFDVSHRIPLLIVPFALSMRDVEFQDQRTIGTGLTPWCDEFEPGP